MRSTYKMSAMVPTVTCCDALFKFFLRWGGGLAKRGVNRTPTLGQPGVPQCISPQPLTAVASTYFSIVSTVSTVCAVVSTGFQVCACLAGVSRSLRSLNNSLMSDRCNFQTSRGEKKNVTI